MHICAQSQRLRPRVPRTPAGAVQVKWNPAAAEKGIDVRMALDIVRMAHRRDYDAGGSYSAGLNATILAVRSRTSRGRSDLSTWSWSMRRPYFSPPAASTNSMLCRRPGGVRIRTSTPRASARSNRTAGARSESPDTRSARSKRPRSPPSRSCSAMFTSVSFSSWSFQVAWHRQHRRSFPLNRPMMTFTPMAWSALAYSRCRL